MQDRHPNANLLELLEDACSSPLVGVADRYRRLKLSADRGTRLKDELVARAWARTTRIQLADRAFVALVPTRAGLAVLRNPPAWPEPDDHASAEHEFWKGWLFGELRKRGLAVHAERTLLNGHRVDLLVAKGERALAIEVETGKSDIAGNVAAARSGGVAQLVIVATSREALAAVEETLATSTAGIRVLLGAEVATRPGALDSILACR